jgi:D-tyrosyl-tRNA(Tyr) deacylase
MQRAWRNPRHGAVLMMNATARSLPTPNNSWRSASGYGGHLQYRGSRGQIADRSVTFLPDPVSLAPEHFVASPARL